MTVLQGVRVFHVRHVFTLKTSQLRLSQDELLGIKIKMNKTIICNKSIICNDYISYT